MEKTYGRLQIFFEDPFWVGIFERTDNHGFAVCKVTFGAEPRGQEVLDYLQRYYYRLRFSPVVEGENLMEKSEHINPKRLLRNAKREMKQTGIGTKSQQALKLQHELVKTERKERSKEYREEELKRKFELKQQKKKEKKKGH